MADDGSKSALRRDRSIGSFWQQGGFRRNPVIDRPVGRLLPSGSRMATGHLPPGS
jgi:hypothetical protein